MNANHFSNCIILYSGAGWEGRTPDIRRVKALLYHWVNPAYFGASGRIRTCDPQLRRLLFYPLNYTRKSFPHLSIGHFTFAHWVFKCSIQPHFLQIPAMLCSHSEHIFIRSCWTSSLTLYWSNIGAGYQNRTDDRRLEICCFTIKLIPHLVRLVGLEPTWLTPTDFKSVVYTDSTTVAKIISTTP